MWNQMLLISTERIISFVSSTIWSIFRCATSASTHWIKVANFWPILNWIITTVKFVAIYSIRLLVTTHSKANVLLGIASFIYNSLCIKSLGHTYLKCIFSETTSLKNGDCWRFEWGRWSSVSLLTSIYLSAWI